MMESDADKDQGPGTLFETANAPRLMWVTDGTTNTIMMVEADDERRVPWTKPADLAYDPQRPAEGLGHKRSGSAFLALFADGHVQFISRKNDSKVLHALFTHAGGEICDMNALNKGAP